MAIKDIKKIENKCKYLIFRDTEFYPYVDKEFSNLKEAEKEFRKCSNNGGEGVWYLCKVLKEQKTYDKECPEIKKFIGQEGSGKSSIRKSRRR